jgi:hypothetical protein
MNRACRIGCAAPRRNLVCRERLFGRNQTVLADRYKVRNDLEIRKHCLPFLGSLDRLVEDFRAGAVSGVSEAMNVHSGETVYMFHPRHRHEEWIQFLTRSEAATPAGKEIHLIMDNYSAHKHAIPASPYFSNVYLL